MSVRFFAVSRGLFRYGERLVGHDAAFRSLADLRVRVYERLERLAPTGLHGFHRGDLLARVVRDVDALQDVGLRVLPAWWIAGVVGLATTVALWLLLPTAAIAVAVALLVAAIVVPWLSGALARRTEARKAPARGELAASVVDLLEGAPDLVAFGATDAQVRRVMAYDAELTQVAAANAGTSGVGAGLISLCTGIATWAALVLGVSAVHDGRLEGVMLAVVALIPLAAFELVAPLPAASQALEGARHSAARLEAVLDAPPPITEPATPVALEARLPSRPPGARPVERATRSMPRGRSPASTSTSVRVDGSRSSVRAGQGSRRLPPYSLGSWTTTRGRFASTAPSFAT